MAHSHIAVRHLLRQVELFAADREERFTPPDWVAGFVQNVADLFLPFRGLARAGYECTRTDDQWELSVFLGQRELVGGPDDGSLRPTNFQFDLARLAACFESLETVVWNAFPDQACLADAADLSMIVAQGTVAGEAVSLQVHASPPEDLGPALRQYSDGNCVPV